MDGQAGQSALSLTLATAPYATWRHEADGRAKFDPDGQREAAAAEQSHGLHEAVTDGTLNIRLRSSLASARVARLGSILTLVKAPPFS